MNSISRLVVFTGLLVFLSACSSKAGFIKYEQISTNLAKYERVSISVRAENALIEAKKGYDITKQEFEKAIIEKLYVGNKYASVNLVDDNNPPKSGYQIVLTFTDFEYLSGAASILGGVFSGNARLKVHVKVIDVKDKKQLGEYLAVSGTSSSGGIFRGSTSGLIEAISTEIANEILVNTKKIS